MQNEQARGRAALSVVRWIAPFAWMGLIFFLSAQSKLPHLQSASTKLQDTAGHLFLYLVLGLLWQWALRGAGVRRPALWSAAICVLYGISDEIHQSMVPGRAVELYDVMIDTIGGAIGAWMGNRANQR